MTTKPTSMEAYHDLLDAGLITKRAHELLEFIATFQDSIGGMVSRADIEFQFNDTTSSYGPRLMELERKGLVYVAGIKKSVKTGRDIQGWRASEQYDQERVACRARSSEPKQSLSQLAETIDDLVTIAEAKLGMSLKDAVATLRMGSSTQPQQSAH